MSALKTPWKYTFVLGAGGLGVIHLCLRSPGAAFFSKQTVRCPSKVGHVVRGSDSGPAIDIEFPTTVGTCWHMFVPTVAPKLHEVGGCI